MEEWVIRLDRLGRHHIERSIRDLAARERCRKIRLDDDLPAPVVDEDDTVLHLRDTVRIDECLRLRRKRAVEKDKVRFAQQRIERHIFRERPPLRALRAAVGEHADVHRAQDACDRLTDAPKSNDACRLAADLDQRTLPIAEVDAPRPLPRMHGAIMKADLRARLEEECYRILCDIVRTIDGHVHDRNIPLACIRRVHDIVARREYSNRLEVWTGVNDRARERGLVRHGDLRIADALRDQRRLRERRAVVNRHRTQRLQRRPADVPRVLCISVEHNNLHGTSSSTVLRINPFIAFSILHEFSLTGKKIFD